MSDDVFTDDDLANAEDRMRQEARTDERPSPVSELRDAAWEAVAWLEGHTDQAEGDAATASRLRAALALAQVPAQTECWACNHPSHGSGTNGSGCSQCFCTQTEYVGGRPLAALPAQEEK